MFVGYRIIVAYRIDDAFVVTRQYVHLPIEYIVPWYVFEVWSLSICQPLCDNPDDIWALFSHISQTYQRRFHATYKSLNILSFEIHHITYITSNSCIYYMEQS